MMGDNHFDCNTSSTCSDDISHLVRQILVRSSSPPPPPRRPPTLLGGLEQGIAAVGSFDRVCSGNVRTSCGSSSVGVFESEADEFDCESEEGLEALVDESPTKAAPPRSSAKRSRAAEVHNLSEKRRRSRINEKMKALQNLIPNSNKTDKASMLDEAIEYLKQLQLQVQMLSFRNGLALHPMCLPGTLQSVQLPQSRVSPCDENRPLHLNLLNTVPMNQGISAEDLFNLPNQCTSSKPVPLPNLSVMTNSENTFGWESPTQASFVPLQPLTSSPDFCRQDILSQTQLNTNQQRTNQSAPVLLNSQADVRETSSLASRVMARDTMRGLILSQHLTGR